MKKITLLSIALLISYIGQSQDTKSADLLAEYQNLNSSPYPLRHHFNDKEVAILQDHFSQQNETEEPRAGVANDVNIIGTNYRNGNDPTFTTFNTATPDVIIDINLALTFDSNPSDFESTGDINPNNPNEAFVLTFEGSLYSLDIRSGVYTLMGIIPPPPNELWTGTDFDPSTGIFYAMSGSFGIPAVSSLSIINIDELSISIIGDTRLGGPIAIAADDAGNFYIEDLDTDALYSVNVETAETTFIGQLGFDASFSQDMTFDNATGILWMTAFNFSANSPELRTVDTSTGETTLIGRLGNEPGDQITWCAIPDFNPLSVNDNSVTQVSIFPNPTQGVLNINAEAPMNQITIYNSLGQNVATYTANNLQTYSVDTAGMANGLYVVELTTSLGIVTEKFIKQ